MGTENWTVGPAGTDSADLELRARIERDLPRLLALARRLTRNEHDAEEAVQGALERGWRARSQLRDPAATESWLRSILARGVVDSHRRTRDLLVADHDDLDEVIPDVNDPAALLVAVEEEMPVRAALRTLSPADRIAIVLHDAEGWPAAAIADLLEIGTEAAHKRVQRARVRLIAALAKPAPSRRSPTGAMPTSYWTERSTKRPAPWFRHISTRAPAAPLRCRRP